MKKKTKVIASAVATIALCTSLAVGGTFALFTSESKVNVAISSGTVDVVAQASELSLYSPTVIDSDGTFIDETNAATSDTFANGGTASIDGETITISNLTPGDKVTFSVSVRNNSNVSTKYRVKIACKQGLMLFSALDFKVGGEDFTRVRSYLSAWETLVVGVNPDTVEIEIAMPVTAGNRYQNLSAQIAYTIEAIQGNAATESGRVIEYIQDGELTEVSDTSELLQAVANNQNVVLTAPVSLPEILCLTSDLAIYGNGESGRVTLTAPEQTALDMSNRVIDVSDSTEPVTLTLVGVDLVGPTSGTYTRGVSVYDNDDITIVIDDCSLSANYYALNIAGANDNAEVVVKNSTIVGWAAFQTWSSGTKATFENCTIIGNNDKGYNADGWNDFATVVVNTDTTDVELTFKNCRIEANQTTGNNQYLLSIRSERTKVTFTNCTYFANGSEITGDALGNYVSVYSPEAVDFVFTVDGTVIPLENLNIDVG